METSRPIQGLVSHEFLQEKTCEWLHGTLERTRTDSLSTFIAAQCAENIQDHEIWIPLFHTFSSTEFNIGETRFRTISKPIMEKWCSHVPPQYRDKPEVMISVNRKRSKLQGLLAATCKIKAERRKATELARNRAADAVAFVRFLSPANFHSRLRSHCTLLGSEAVSMATELFMEGDLIVQMHEGVHGQTPMLWHLEESLGQVPGVLEALDNLARDTTTDFRKILYESLILYSRQALASDLSEKLVFLLAALESSLLRDGSEPIQKNLGERIAFLIGSTVEERRGILKNVEQIYRIRSAFVHHGHKPQHVEALDVFLTNSWRTFARLLDLRDSYRTKIELINALEDRKMA